MAEENKATRPTQHQPDEPLPWIYNEFLRANKKISWPEVVGVTGEEAKRKIEEDMPGAKVYLLLPPIYATQQDFVPNRVWLFLDESHKVFKTPYIG